MPTLRIGPELAGTRLDAALAAVGLAASRAEAQRLLDAGAVTVDGRARPKSHRVAAGERVDVAEHVEADADEAPPAPYRVAHVDEHLAVVDKPAGVVVHPAGGRRRGTLAQALAAAGLAAGGDDPERPGLVHRLDRDTSGLLVVARDDATLRALQALLRARGIRREYLALVAGRPPARTGTIDAPLGRDRRVRTRRSVDTDEPRAAVTHFAVVETLPAATLLRVTLETGRTHQIRAHLHAIGHPVCGDVEYGGGRVYGLRRQFLHAARLAFLHPVTGVAVDVSSELPGDLAVALDSARAAE